VSKGIQRCIAAQRAKVAQDAILQRGVDEKPHQHNEATPAEADRQSDEGMEASLRRLVIQHFGSVDAAFSKFKGQDGSVNRKGFKRVKRLGAANSSVGNSLQHSFLLCCAAAGCFRRAGHH